MTAGRAPFLVAPGHPFRRRTALCVPGWALLGAVLEQPAWDNIPAGNPDFRCNVDSLCPHLTSSMKPAPRGSYCSYMSFQPGFGTSAVLLPNDASVCPNKKPFYIASALRCSYSLLNGYISTALSASCGKSREGRDPRTLWSGGYPENHSLSPQPGEGEKVES